VALGIGAVALILGALWVFAKLNGLSVGTLGRMAADMRQPGANAVDVLDKYVPVRLWNKVKREAKLNSDLP